MATAFPKYVKPVISQEQAQEILTERKWFQIKKRLLKRIELVYLPHYFFHLVITLKTGEKEVVASTDALLGAFALTDTQTLEYETTAVGEKFSAKISRAEAEKTCLDEYRKLLLNYGLRQKEFVGLKALKNVEEVMYPFWVAYFQIRGKYDIPANAQPATVDDTFHFGFVFIGLLLDHSGLQSLQEILWTVSPVQEYKRIYSRKRQVQA